MRRVSEGERLIAAVARTAETRRKSAVSAILFPGSQSRRLLDDRTLFISMAVPVAPKLEIRTAPGSILLMKRLTIYLAAILVASIGLAQDKAQPQLKDQKEKASYSIGHELARP